MVSAFNGLKTRYFPMAALFATLALLTGCGSASLSTPSTDTLVRADADQSGLGSSFTGADTARTKPLRPSNATRKIVEQSAATSQPGNAGYKIGPQDVLEFAVFKAPELQRTVQVSETGSINLPLLGDQQASGRTATELEKDIAQRLGKKYLQNPQVSINIREYNSQRITLEGAVKKPGVYPLRGRSTLLQVIATAEGFTDIGDATVVIFRNDGGQRMVAKFDIASIRSGASSDPVLQAGDTIVAPTSFTKEAFATIMKALPLATFAALAL